MVVLQHLMLLATYVLLLCCIQGISGETVRPEGANWPVREFRAVFMATVSNMDWPLASDDTPDQQKAELITFLDKLQQLNFNALVFQIRPACDSMYNSSLEPWSVYLTGTQGKAPSPFYDPLAFILEEAHKRNIEVHSWYNPYRAKANSTSRHGLAPNHMAIKYSQYAYSYGGNLWMDPAAPEVQDQCFNVIMDVVKRYDVDGVHMDDYYYPYPVKGQHFPDNKLYNAYRNEGGHLGKDDWRRENVNTLIQRIYNGIKATRKEVKMGLSPWPVWKAGKPNGTEGLSSYSGLYADTKKWFSEGWVDFLTPLLYSEIDSPRRSFTYILDWWLAQNSKQRHLYPGSYAGRVTVSNWPVGEIKRQVEESRKRRDQLTLGDIFFSAKYFRDNSKGLSTMFKQDLYTNPALPPPMPWLGTNPPPAPSDVKASGSVLTWNKDTSGRTRSWAVYREKASMWTLVKVLNKDTTSCSVSDGKYVISAVDRLSNQSDGVVVEVRGGNSIIG